VIISGEKQQFLDWLSWGVESGAIHLSVESGPIHRSKLTLKDMFTDDPAKLSLVALEMKPKWRMPRNLGPVDAGESGAGSHRAQAPSSSAHGCERVAPTQSDAAVFVCDRRRLEMATR
jgi:hypothetical protein